MVTSDASGRRGCGAFCNTQWFLLEWPESLPNYHITVKELIPVVIAAAIWGAKWAHSHVRARSDNSAIVAIISGGYSRDADVMHLMKCLHFLSTRCAFRLSAEHIKGSLNEAADACSWDSLSSFQAMHPSADKEPTPIPPLLLDLLLGSKPDWLSVACCGAQLRFCDVMGGLFTRCFFGFFRSGELTSPLEIHSDPEEHLTFADILDALPDQIILDT